jgi:hypothetical protein
MAQPSVFVREKMQIDVNHHDFIRHLFYFLRVLNVSAFISVSHYQALVASVQEGKQQ